MKDVKNMKKGRMPPFMLFTNFMTLTNTTQ